MLHVAQPATVLAWHRRGFRLREVVTLYYCEGRSVSQVADLLGLSDAAVRQRLSRARACLRADLLERAGQELAASAPGAAFVAGVTTALTLGAPAASAAATVGMTSLKTGGVLAKIAAAIGGAGIGAVGGVAGIVLGLRPARRQARDEQEWTGLRRLQAVGIAVVLAFVIAVSFFARMLAQGRMLAHWRWVAVGLFVAYYVSLFAVLEFADVINGDVRSNGAKPRSSSRFKPDGFRGCSRPASGAHWRDRLTRATVMTLPQLVLLGLQVSVLCRSSASA